MSLLDENSVEVQNLQDTHKTRGIVAHITLIGWIIALVQNSNDKNEFASFYIRQMLGLFLTGVAINIASMILMLIPFLGWLIVLAAGLTLVAAWIYSLIGAVNGKKQLLPVIGHLFQDWFKSM